MSTRLADFILANREPILADWEAFARALGTVSGSMDIAALRDHADEMLTVIADDLCTPQSKTEQKEKSKGNAPGKPRRKTAAEQHGAERAESGFTIEQMVSEYRALRASVIRLWTKEQGELKTEDISDLTRFNEAIDQALAESVTRYTADLDYSKEMFLAILGHDMRTPLGAVMTSAKFMLETGELKEPYLTLTSRIASSSTRMVHMVGDLLDFTRSRLGSGIPITRKPMSLEKTALDVVEEMRVVHPGRKIDVSVEGDERGEFDCPRITQVLTNLIGNAIEHGSNRSAVKVTLGGTKEEAMIAIHNFGAPISAEEIRGIFNPMKRRADTAKAAKGGPIANLGLGLYIADRIVSAHKGTIQVESSEVDGTTFTVRLPRREEPAPVPTERTKDSPTDRRA
jgi:signal transduction histidine kinase